MTDAAWLSSARVVRCWVKSRNERNPCYQLPASKVGHSDRTAGDKPEEGGDDVKSSWLLRVGLHTCYNGSYREERSCEAEPILKSCLSSSVADRPLRPAIDRRFGRPLPHQLPNLPRAVLSAINLSPSGLMRY